MGRLHERKGLSLLIEAFKAANVPDSRLLIVGPDAGMQAQIEPLLDERIVLTGFLDGADRLAAFAAADLLALPAVGEGLPMVVLEAMGAGLPVIISPGCYLPEVAMHGAGLVVEPEVEPLRAALVELLRDPAQRRTMGHCGRELVKTQFTWDAVALQLEDVYQSLLLTADAG
jgi:glycosyltransferase involved in cell wall biosynthesis